MTKKRLFFEKIKKTAEKRRFSKVITKGLETLGINTFTHLLTSATDSFSLTTSFFLAVFFMATAQFHFTENAFSLHLLFQDFQRLVNIISDNRNLYHLNHPFLYSLKLICDLFNIRFFNLQAKNHENYAIIFGLMAVSTRFIFLARPFFSELRRFA